MTPRGEAEVYNITEDSGVMTSEGNYCRSELSQVPEQFVPKVGEECEVWHGDVWISCLFLGEILYGDYGYQISSGEYKGEMNGDKQLGNFRPIKTEREKVQEWVESRVDCLGDYALDQAILITKLLDLGCLVIPDDKK